MPPAAVLLANSHDSWCLPEHGPAPDAPYHHMRTPKALAPIGADEACALDAWWKILRAVKGEGVTRTFLVCNAAFFKHFERWATASDFPVDCIINDGTTDAASGLGPAASLALLTRRTGTVEGIIVMDCELGAPDAAARAGIANRLDDVGSFALRMEASGPPWTWSAPVLVLTAPALQSIVDGEADLKVHGGLGALSQALALESKTLFAPASLARFDPPARPAQPLAAVEPPIVQRACCRVGVMGNPSDGFFGKTISLSVANFWAEVRLWPSKRLAILPHPLYDPLSFGGLADLHAIVSHEGTNGGVRLLLAACKRFYEYCQAHAIELRHAGCTLAYDTNVPRQVGLAGSSAILTATVRALMQFHGVGAAQLPTEALPSLVLAIERDELGINAGLQDRVIQAYGGLVFMDFERAHLQATGRGKYERLPIELAPPLWLAYLADPSDSGKIHNDVRQRYDAGDAAVVAGMARFGAMTSDARQAILDGDRARLGELMDSNFALRRTLYGDGALGAANLKMVQIAQRHGVPAKFPGSGGAVVGLCIDDAAAMTAMQHELERNGCVFVRVAPAPPLG